MVDEVELLVVVWVSMKRKEDERNKVSWSAGEVEWRGRSRR